MVCVFLQLDSLFGGKLKAWSQFIYLASQGLDGLLRTSEATFSVRGFVVRCSAVL